MSANNGRRRLAASELNDYPERVRGLAPLTADGAICPIIYGRDETEGYKFAEVQSGGVLYVGMAWCLGPINKVESVKINDVRLSDLSGVTAVHYSGSLTQEPDPWLESVITDYKDDLIFTLPGGNVPVAYSVFKINSGAIDGAPRFRATIQGKLVVDPTAGSGTDPLSGDVTISVDWTDTGADTSSNAHTINLEGGATFDSGGLQLGASPESYAWVQNDTTFDLGTSEFCDEWVFTADATGGSPDTTRETLVSCTDTASPHTKVYQIDAIGDELKLFLSSDGATWDICNDVAIATITTSKTYITIERVGNQLTVYDDGVESYTQELTTGSPLTAQSIYTDTGSPALKWYIATQNAAGNYFVGSIQAWRRTTGTYRYGAPHVATATPWADSNDYAAGTVYSSKPALFWKDLAESSVYGLGATTTGVTDALTWGDGFLEDGFTVRATGIGITIATPRRAEEWLDLFAQYARCVYFPEGANLKIKPDRPVQADNNGGLTELTTNGAFDAISPEGWSMDAGVSISSGNMWRLFPTSPDVETGGRQTITTEAGAAYGVEITFTKGSPNIGYVRVLFDGTEIINTTEEGTFSAFGTATTTSTEIEILTGDNGTSGVSNISVRRKFYKETKVLANTFQMTPASQRGSPTSVAVEYTVPKTGAEPWASTQEVITLPQATAGTLPFVQTSLSLPGIKNVERAKNHGVLKLQQEYKKVEYSYETTGHAAFFEPGDVAQVVISNRGIDTKVWIEDVEMSEYGIWRIRGRNYCTWQEETSPGTEVLYQFTDAQVPEFFGEASYLDMLVSKVNKGSSYGAVWILDMAAWTGSPRYPKDESKFGRDIDTHVGTGETGHPSFLNDGRTSTLLDQNNHYYRDSGPFTDIKTGAASADYSGTFGICVRRQTTLDSNIIGLSWGSAQVIMKEGSNNWQIFEDDGAAGPTSKTTTFSATTSGDHNLIVVYDENSDPGTCALYDNFVDLGDTDYAGKSGWNTTGGDDVRLYGSAGSLGAHCQYAFYTDYKFTTTDVADLQAAWNRNKADYSPEEA